MFTKESQSYHNEFDILKEREAHFENILLNQTNTIAEFAKNHSKNFVNKPEIA